MAKILAYVRSGFLRYNLPVVFTSCREPISKVVGGLHCFSPEIIGKSVVNKHYVFYGNNGSPSLLNKTVFFVHIWGHVFDRNSMLLVKGAEFN